MRFQVRPINALPLFPGLPLGATHLSLRVGLSTVRRWSREPWGTPRATSVCVAAMDLGKPLRSGRMPCRLENREMMRQHGKNVVAFICRHVHNLGGDRNGSHSCRRTHALVQPARCGSMAAVTVILDHPVRSLPLVREVRGDERLPQWSPSERCQERRGAGPG